MRKLTAITALVLTHIAGAHAQQLKEPVRKAPPAQSEQKIVLPSVGGSNPEAKREKKSNEKRISFDLDTKARGGSNIGAREGGSNIGAKEGGSNIGAKEGGSNIGGSPDTIEISEWSSEIPEILTEAEQIAVQKRADGSPALAIDQYKAGLTQVLTSVPDGLQGRPTWTYKTAERALALVERLGSDPLMTSEVQLDVMTFFYDLIRSHYEQLDVPYYAIRYGRPGSAACDVNYLDSRLQIYANTLLDWFEKTMVMVARNQHGIEVTPRYSDRAFFITLGTIAKGLSEDFGARNSIDPPLFPTRYANAARKLARVARQMDEVLAGSGTYSSNPRAVQGAYNDLQKIRNELK